MQLRISFAQMGVVPFLCSALTLAACGTATIPIQVIHPGQANLSKYKRIAFAGIDGRLGNEFAASLKEKMSGHFDLIDRSKYDAVLRELQISQSDITDEKYRSQLGKMLPASAVITGIVDATYNEEHTVQQIVCPVTGYNGQLQFVPCRQNIRKGIATVTGSVDITDVETGRIICTKQLHGSSQGQTAAVEAEPARLDGNALVHAALTQSTNIFAKVILPWSETVQVAFERDSSLPELDIGIRQAQVGDLSEAIETFKRAAMVSEQNKNISPKVTVKAYWNLALAYMYGQQFDDAMEAFKRVDVISPGAFDTIEARSRVKRLKHEYVRMAADTN